ncbi:sensor histidine kinase [Actinokineospora enzanensis]|uniref:sensor histidine kinase n=1 Tax=Actinokineospora enzanensis TaxID=155975 RepID=UPI00037B6ED2|nr:sensor histidine kinase [Actinokineospora enzanensis]
MDTITPTSRALTWSLHLLVAGLLALAAIRGLIDHTPATIAAAALMAGTYAIGPATPRIRSNRRAAATWLTALSATWLILLALTQDGAWLAFPLYFLQLHLLHRAALPAVAATATAAVIGFSAHAHSFTPATAIGPFLGAAVATAVVRGYQALYRESDRRQQLIHDLTTTRADLAQAQHTAGVLAERERLAREIHDTLAQGLSSIQLLLHAAERAPTPETTLRHVEQARQAAADNLTEARRFVAALSPPGLEGSTLADALHRLCATTSSRHPLKARFQETGIPGPLPTAHEVALLRVAQSALANTVQHARATTAELTLTHASDHVTLTITDDGTGCTAPEGFGLAGMRARARDLNGTFEVRSANGTAVTIRLPRGAGS